MIDTVLTAETQGALAALDLFERGQTSEALEALESCPPSPERLLVQGAILALERPDEAKDMLSEAFRFLAGETACKAQIWLSCCYWSIGEINEARDVIDRVRPETNAVKFLLGSTRAAFEIENPEYALSLLVAVESYADEVNPFWRGKFFNQRGAILRRLGELDRAIITYEEARMCFEEAENPRALAGASSNLARALADQGEFAQAHGVIDKAIDSLVSIGDNVYLAQAYDQKASILLAQKRYIEALETSPKAIVLLKDRQQKELLARALLTEADALTKLGQFAEAFLRLERAVKTANHLDNRDLQFDALSGRKQFASALLRESDRALIKNALKGRSYRAAAKKIGISHALLFKWMDKYKIKRKPK